MGYYIAISNGYYETKLREKNIMTEEQIKRFEEDIKLGKEIDFNEYLNPPITSYDNKMSRAGATFSEKSEKVMQKGIGMVIDLIEKLFGGY